MIVPDEVSGPGCPDCLGRRPSSDGLLAPVGASMRSTIYVCHHCGTYWDFGFRRPRRLSRDLVGEMLA